jgi:lipopolysaccharide transport system ATP-binding protein
MDEVSRQEGRTVIFVSHNLGILTSLCPFAILIDRGSIHRRGATRDIITDYLADRSRNLDRLVKLDERLRKDVEDGDRVRLTSIEWLCDVPLQHGEPARARIHFKTRGPLADVSVVIGFSNLEGTRLLTYRSDYPDGVRCNLSQSGVHSVDIEVDSLPLAPGVMNLDVLCVSGDSHVLDDVYAAIQLEIVPGPTTPGSIFHGVGGVRGIGKWAWNDQ